MKMITTDSKIGIHKILGIELWNNKFQMEIFDKKGHINIYMDKGKITKLKGKYYKIKV